MEKETFGNLKLRSGVFNISSYSIYWPCETFFVLSPYSERQELPDCTFILFYPDILLFSFNKKVDFLWRIKVAEIF